MREGTSGGLQFHWKKDETGFIMRGKLEIEYDPGTGTLEKVICEVGDVFRFPQGAVHRATALEETFYVEASTPYLNDRCHVEEFYGEEKETGGLPSTNPDDVIKCGH
jgi:mannose-6-phosphate isomerase